MNTSNSDSDSDTRPGRPTFDGSSIGEYLTQHWGSHFCEGDWVVQSLASDADQAFRISSSGQDSYLLKVANSETPPTYFALEEACLSATEAAGLPVQRLVLAGDGRLQVVLSDDTGSYVARLFCWLNGSLYSSHRPHDRVLHKRLGSALADLDQALASVDPELGESARDWDLLQCRAAIDRHLGQLDDADQRQIAQIRDRLEEIEPTLRGLRRQVIHGDANDNNVLVELDGTGDATIAGIIDFGDSVTSALVCEVAIGMAYAMLDVPDPMAAGAAVVAGYCSRLPLTEVEVSLLFDLVRSRLALSVSMSAFQKQLEPDNEYLVVSEGPAWRLLSHLDEISKEYAEFCFRSAAGFEPVVSSAAVVEWLSTHRGLMSEILRPELLESDGVALVDLSVQSELFSPGDSQEEVDQRVTRLLAADGKTESESRVGVGRYGESRLLYLGDQFDDDDGARTVHLGIDLFAPAGEPVFAPLDGEVVSFVDNDVDYDYGPTLILRHFIEEGLAHPLEFFTLWGHLSRASIPGLEPGQAVVAGQKLAELGSLEENGGWPPHLHLQLITSLFDDSGNFSGVTHPQKLDVWSSISPSPVDLLGVGLLEALQKAGFEPAVSAERVERLAERRQRSLAPNLSLSYRSPLEIVRGRGAYLFDGHANCYLDLVNNVCHVGHCHPQVVAAGQRQMRLLNTNTRYLHEERLAYAEALLEKLPDSLSVLYLVNSGSEANDLALRLARAATGRRGVVTLDGGYHGNLGSLVDISPYKHDGPGGSGTPSFVAKATMPDPYRGEFRELAVAEASARYAEAVVVAARGLSEPAGAFIAEPILSCGGQVVPPPGFFAQVYAAMRELGVVCVSDEVQVGFGRVGESFWGFELHGVVPDIVTMGKPIGNGHPMAAVVTTREIAQAFDNGMEYFNTFGGNPVSCAIGSAVLDVIEREELQEKALVVGGALKKGLEELATYHELIGDVRGHGLFLGFELVEDRDTLEPAAAKATRLVERMRRWGFLLSTDGPLHNVIKIKPPLQISEGDAFQTLQALDEVLGESALQPRPVEWPR